MRGGPLYPLGVRASAGASPPALGSFMPSLDPLPSCGPDGNDEEVLPGISPKGAVAMGINGKLLAVWVSQGCFPVSASWPNLGAEGKPHYWGSKDMGGRFCSVFPFSLLRTSGFSSAEWG